MGRGSSKVGGDRAFALTRAKKAEIDKFKGKTGSIVPLMIERSPHGISVDAVKSQLRTSLEKDERNGVEVDYYALKGDIDSKGFADVEVAYDISSNRYSGGHDLGTGRAIVRTSKTRKYKTMRVKLMDFGK